jgi:hypothetical protein
MHEWQVRRATECCAAHADPAFGEPIDAERDPSEIADLIADRLRDSAPRKDSDRK